MVELLTEQTLKKLTAKNVDPSFRQEIIKQMQKDAKRANSRLLRIEKTGLEDVSNSYQRAVFYADMERGNARFRISPSKMSTTDILQEYREIRTFLSKESSTVKGIKYQQKRFMNAMDAFDIHISNKDEFFRFINSDTIQDAIEVIGNYDIIMDAINSAIEKLHKDLDSIKKEFDYFIAGKMHYDELLERLGGETLDDLYVRHRRRKFSSTKVRYRRKR